MIFIFAAPSGSGKSTLINYLLQQYNDLEFSISATTRPPRGKEQNGKEYYFISPEEFEKMIADNQFIEWEKVYENTYYGTPKSEIERIEKNNHHIIFDLDVYGAIHLKQIFGDKAHTFFISPPSVAELQRRLEKRATDSPQKIAERVAKAEIELQKAEFFDEIIVNDDLEKAKQQLKQSIDKFIRNESVNK